MHTPIKSHYTHRLSILLLWLCFLLISTSCKKEVGQQEIATVIGQYPVSYVGESNAVRVGGLAVSNTTMPGTGLPVLLAAPASGDVQVTAQVDTSLVDDFENYYGIKFPTLPFGAFALSNNGAITVKNGQSQSADSVKVVLQNASQLVSGATYLIPVRLTAVNASLKAPYFFLKMKVNIKEILASMEQTSSFGNSFNTTVNGSLSLLADFRFTSINGVMQRPDSIQIQAGLNETVTVDTRAMAAVDVRDSMVAAFGSNTFASVKAFPAGSYQLVKNTVSFAANNLYSTDSFVVRIVNYDAFESDTIYVLPVKIVPTPGYVPPNTDQGKFVGFIRFKITRLASLNIHPSNSGLTGTIMNRAGWNAYSYQNPQFDFSPGSKTLDGDNTTYWNPSGFVPLGLVVDMGSIQTVKGFLLTPQYAYTAADFLTMDVYTSNDNTNWTKQGTYFGTPPAPGSDATNPDIKAVRFVTPVQARYVRFMVLTTSEPYQTTRIAEVNGVQ